MLLNEQRDVRARRAVLAPDRVTRRCNFRGRMQCEVEENSMYVGLESGRRRGIHKAAIRRPQENSCRNGTEVASEQNQETGYCTIRKQERSICTVQRVR